MSHLYKIAIVGATGVVGRQIIAVLEERKFPVAELKLLTSERSIGKNIKFNGTDITVEALKKNSFTDVEIAIFSAGSEISMKYVPIAVETGAIVIDNSSTWRMDTEIPLVVPEVNHEDIVLYKNRGIIANPNCSTIQMVVVLYPLHVIAKIKRIVVSTYQSVSGSGQKAIDELSNQVLDLFSCKKTKNKVYPHRIAFNVIPHIDMFLDNGYTKEEMKIILETKKIMKDETINITATAVRIPVFYGHSESINIETSVKLTTEEVRQILIKSKGVKVIDLPEKYQYPMPINTTGDDLITIGRIRNDISIENGINLWTVCDNLRKGAATNAIQIAEILVHDYL